MSSKKPTSLPAPKKPSKADFLKGWGLDEPWMIKAGFTWLRYKNPPEKGVYWYYFSLFIRKRDIEKWGNCISCKRPITMENSNAGHFMPAADCGPELLFDEKNVNGECEHCNAWDDTHLLGYAEGLDFRYGPGTARRLRQKRETFKSKKQVFKELKGPEYAQMVRKLPTYAQRNAVLS